MEDRGQKSVFGQKRPNFCMFTLIFVRWPWWPWCPQDSCSQCHLAGICVSVILLATNLRFLVSDFPNLLTHVHYGSVMELPFKGYFSVGAQPYGFIPHCNKAFSHWTIEEYCHKTSFRRMSQGTLQQTSFRSLTGKPVICNSCESGPSFW